MNNNHFFEVIIIGGSYSGLSAAMALGRSLRSVLIIDSQLPCNRQTPRSHNFITQDGEKPNVIAQKAKSQVLQYKTIEFEDDIAIEGQKTETGFKIITANGKTFESKKLLSAAGLKDNLPKISGMEDCWGISVIHCPYCHGYEVRQTETGILANGDFAMHYAQLVYNLTKTLTIFTNGAASFSQEQRAKLLKNNIVIEEKQIIFIEHTNGHIQRVQLEDNSFFSLNALYTKPDFEQHCKIPEALGCLLTAQGLLQVDGFQATNVAGVFACGDSTSPMRSVANAVSTGNLAGARINFELSEESF